jgi:hypothetical protein
MHIEVACGEVWRVDAVVVDTVRYGPEQRSIGVVVKSYGKSGGKTGQAGDGPTFGPTVLATQSLPTGKWYL